MAKSAPRRPAKSAAKKGPGPIVVKDVPAGDGSVSLGRLPAGDYAFGIWCKDMKGRESHRVWHLFRVRDAADLTVPEKAVHTMTEADLAGYGLANDDRRERRMPNGKASGAADSAQPGYTVECRAGAKDIAVPGAYKTRKVTYDPGYDKAAVEAEALDNVKGDLKQSLGLNDDTELVVSDMGIIPASSQRVVDWIRDIASQWRQDN